MFKMLFIKRNAILITIFILALAIRFIFVLKSHDIPASDAWVYDRLGLSIAEGRGYTDSDGTPHSLYPPFYPLVLSVIYRVCGHNYTAVRLAQSILGALTCVMIYVLGRKIFYEMVGLIAAVFLGVYLPFIKSSCMLLSELLLTFLLVAVILVLVSLKGARGKIRFALCISAGLLLSAAFLTKSIMFLFPFVAAVIIFLGDGLRNLFAWRKVCIIALFFCVAIAPWIARNYMLYNAFLPVSPEGGLVLYSSYRPARGIFGLIADPQDPVVKEGGAIHSPIMRRDFFVKKTVEFVIRNPKDTIILEMKKILYFWAPYDWEIVGNRWFNVLFVAVLPFFVYGFKLILKLKTGWPILAPIVYFQIMTLLFYGSPRFRLPIDPFIFLVSAVGMISCGRLVFFESRRKIAS